MKTKHVICLTIAAILILTTIFAVANGNTLTALVEDFKLFVDGDEIELEQPIVTIDGRSFLPMRELANLLGYAVYWNEERERIVLFEIPGIDPVPLNQTIQTIYPEWQIQEYHNRYPKGTFKELTSTFSVECIRQAEGYFYTVLKTNKEDLLIHLFKNETDPAISSWYIRDWDSPNDKIFGETVKEGQTTLAQVKNVDPYGVYVNANERSADMPETMYSIHRTTGDSYRSYRIDYRLTEIKGARVYVVETIEKKALMEDLLYFTLFFEDKQIVLDIMENAPNK